MHLGRTRIAVLMANVVRVIYVLSDIHEHSQWAPSIHSVTYSLAHAQLGKPALCLTVSFLRGGYVVVGGGGG